MLTTVIVTVTFILALCILAFSKQDMLKKMFTNQLTKPASELQDQLELTADTVIKNLEEHITHLEYLLEQADGRLEKMDQAIAQTDNKLEKIDQAIKQTDNKLEQLDQSIQEAEVVKTLLINTQKSALRQTSQNDFIPLYQVKPEIEQAPPNAIPYAFNQYQQQIDPKELFQEPMIESKVVEHEELSADDDSTGPQMQVMEKKVTLEQDISKLDQSIQQQRPVILAMAKQGYSDTEIAKVTGLGKGEIMLFLQLNKEDNIIK